MANACGSLTLEALIANQRDPGELAEHQAFSARLHLSLTTSTPPDRGADRPDGGGDRTLSRPRKLLTTNPRN